MPNDPIGATGEAVSAPRFDPDIKGLCANLVSVLDCVTCLFIDNAERAHSSQGEVYQVPVSIGDQITAILILSRDAARAESSEALR